MGKSKIFIAVGIAVVLLIIGITVPIIISKNHKDNILNAAENMIFCMYNDKITNNIGKTLSLNDVQLFTKANCEETIKDRLLTNKASKCFFDNNKEIRNSVKERQDEFLKIEEEKGLNSKYLDCVIESKTENDIQKCKKLGIRKTEADCEHIDCSGHGECKEVDNKLTCVCEEGFEYKDKYQCVDIDECAKNIYDCKKGYKCVNTEKTYKCEDIDECIETPTVCKKYCTNNDGSYKCENTIQWGTNSDDYTNSIAIDKSENIIITGFAGENLDNSGGKGVFLTKFDNKGNKLWTKQWGYGVGNSVAVDSSENIFVIGSTNGDLDGNTNAGKSDIFLTKFDNSGNKLWTKQWGTIADDQGNSIIIDNSGNIFVTGATKGDLNGNINKGGHCDWDHTCFDIFLTKLDKDGNQIWTKTIGTTQNDVGKSVTFDESGNLFITGFTFGGIDENINNGGGCADNSYTPCSDIFFSKVDTDGNILFTKQWGTTSNDEGKSIKISKSGDIFVSGFFAKNRQDVLLSKFDSNGNKLWDKPYGTSRLENVSSMFIDKSESEYVFLTGITFGNFEHKHNGGLYDFFLIKLDNKGERIWTKLIGTEGEDESKSVITNNGLIFIVGDTDGNFPKNDCLKNLKNNKCSKDLFLTIIEDN